MWDTLRASQRSENQPETEVRLSRTNRGGGVMAWKVVVDFDVCESNAVCMGIAPEVFEVRDDDFLYILNENPPDELRPRVEQAVRQCPKQAISIVEG
jgi:ferredoxin